MASFNHRLAEEFEVHHHKVELHTFTVQYPNFLFPGKTQYSDDQAPQNLDIKRTISSVNPINWLKMGKELARLNADIVICYFWLPFMAPCFGTILRRIRKNKKSKVISIIHNLIPHEKRIGDKGFIKYFIKPVEGFIAQSSSVLKELESFGINEKVKLVPHPIYDNFGEIVPRNEAIKHLELDAKNKYILFFGFIRDYKGLDILLNAMATDKIKNLNLTLIVAGEFYNNEQKHLKLIEELGISQDIELRTHFIPNDEVRYYFGAADLVVQPYKSATQSGISQMAYHFEKPMVVTNVGGLPEIVPNGKVGYTTDVNSDSIADAISKFYLENKSQEFIDFIKIKKQDFSWTKMMEAVIELSKS